MRKWKVLAFLGVVCGVAGVAWGYAQQQKTIGFYELRVYTVESGKRDGISAPDSSIYMRGYPSRAERDRRLKAAHDDPEFAEVVRKQEGNPETQLIERVHNIDMLPSGAYTAIAITP
jgi:hypothetical protein